MTALPRMLPVREPRPPGHDDREHVEGQQEGEHFRVDGGQEVAEQRPAHAREERRGQKESTLVLKVSMLMTFAAISSSRWP